MFNLFKKKTLAQKVAARGSTTASTSASLRTRIGWMNRSRSRNCLSPSLSIGGGGFMGRGPAGVFCKDHFNQ